MKISFYLFCLIVASPSFSASFDCSKANHNVEREICANASLNALDEELAFSYKAAINLSNNPELVRNLQRNWIKEMRACSGPTTVSCLTKLYRTRIDYLDRLLKKDSGHIGYELKIVRFSDGTLGAEVQSVEENSPAAEAKLEANDLIVSLNGKSFVTIYDIAPILFSKPRNPLRLGVVGKDGLSQVYVLPNESRFIDNAVQQPVSNSKNKANNPNFTNQSAGGFEISYFLILVSMIIGAIALMLKVRSIRADKEREYEEFRDNWYRQRDQSSADNEDEHVAEESEATPPIDEYSQEYIILFWEKILGVSISNTPDEITSAYKTLMRQYHPDKCATLGDALKILADSKSKQINAAYLRAKKVKGF